jgi:hypothetical protein
MAEPDPPDDADAGASGSIDIRLSDPELARADLAELRRRPRSPSIGAKVGDVVSASLDRIPAMPKSRRGRVMARSVIVSFLLVAGWITVIVGLQLRGARPPDFRPDAERILIALRDGKAGEIYEQASERFQGMVRDRETFIDQMTEMNATLGRFVEITAVMTVETNRGPGGRTGRIDVALEYTKTRTRGSVSFRWEKGAWKLLGLAIEVPDAIASNKEERQDRSTARPDEIAALKAAVEGMLMSPVEEVWQTASPTFQQVISLEDLQELERQRARALGRFDRVLDVRQVRLNPARNNASTVVLLQFEKATITGTFEFTRNDDRWQLVSLRLVPPAVQAGP